MTTKEKIIVSIVMSSILALSVVIPYFEYIAVVVIMFIFFYSKKDEENTYR